MTDRLPGKYRSNLHSKPWFFSGKVPEIKYSYTVSGLTPSSYPIRPRSIIPGTKLEIHQPSLIYSNIDESKEQDFKRQFKEYTFLRDQEILVTIEHCDNCEDHLSTTRHDPGKYHNLAQSLKNSILSRYSIVKILIKPLSKLDPEVNKRRLGAFEIQLATKFKGVLSVQVLHSKLSTRKWPDVPEVMKKISKALPSFKLSLTVFDENSQNQTLKGVKVFVRPKILDNDQMRPGSNYSTFRPKSAVTARSCKSFRAMSSRRVSRKELFPKKTKVEYERITDKDGVANFENIPMDVYEIEVEESRDFNGAVKVLNAFDEKLQNGQLNYFLGLKSLGNSNVTVLLRDQVLKTEVTKAKLSLIKDKVEHMFYETKKGVYEISVPKAEYLLVVKCERYKKITKKIVALDTEILISESLELKKSKDLTVNVYDAVTGSGINGVILDLLINNTHSFSGMTKSGKFVFNLQKSGEFYLKSYIKGYIKSKLSIQVSSECDQINVPLVPLNMQSPLIIICSPRLSDPIELFAQTETIELNSNKLEGEGYSIQNRLKTNGFFVVSLPGNSKNLRVSIKALSSNLSTNDGFMNSGLCVQFYSNNRLRSVIKPSMGNGEWWDIGLYSVKHQDFLETNMVSNYKLPVNEFISDVLAIIKYLTIVDSISTAFGFTQASSRQPAKNKDGEISIEAFKDRVKNLISEEFLPWFLESVKINDCVSLQTLVNRFGRYVGIGMNPYKDFSLFVKNFDLNDSEIESYEKILQEGFFSTLPSNWEAVWNKDGDIVYLNENGQYSEEFPGISICKKKILDMQKQEIKRKNSDLGKNEKKTKVSESSKAEKPEKLSEKPKSSSSSSSSKKSDKSKKYQENFSNLYETSIEAIKSYQSNKHMNKEHHKELMDDIEKSIKICEQHLNSHLNSTENEFFIHWVQKLVEVHNAIKSLELETQEVKASKKSSSSSSSSSSSESEELGLF